MCVSTSTGETSADRVLTQFDAFVIGVQQKRAEAVGHVVVSQELQVILTELKLHGELEVDLRGRENGDGGEDDTD